MDANDQIFYDIVAEEIRSRIIVDGLWVRAFSESGGDEGKAKAIYIVHRVGQLKAEALAAKAVAFKRAQAEARQDKERQDMIKIFQKERRKQEYYDECQRKMEAESQRPLTLKGVIFNILVIIMFFGFIGLVLFLR
jgi:hypothetical protein